MKCTRFNSIYLSHINPIYKGICIYVYMFPVDTFHRNSAFQLHPRYCMCQQFIPFYCSVVPLCGCITISWSILQLSDVWLPPVFDKLWLDSLNIFVWHFGANVQKHSFHLGSYLKVGSLVWMVNICLTLQEIAKLFSRMTVAFCIFPSHVQRFQSLCVFAGSWHWVLVALSYLNR